LNPHRERLLRVLRDELRFVEAGGYRSPPTWGVPLLFEDSPTCLRALNNDCASSQCPLLSLVPVEKRSQPGACRFIPLNEHGDAAQDFYRKASQPELESVLRKWLATTIQRLESDFEDPDLA
jgi:hypothetical protein